MNIVANVLTNARFAGWVLTATIIFVCVAELNLIEQKRIIGIEMSSPLLLLLPYLFLIVCIFYIYIIEFHNPCKKCSYYHKENNTCQSKKCATGNSGYVTFADMMFCKPNMMGDKYER